jgi:hypothetical protein
MKPSIQSRILKARTKTATIRQFQTLLPLLLMLMLFTLLSASVTFAQGCGGMSHGGGGGQSGSHDQATAQLSVTLVWTSILHSHSGLQRSVSTQSAPDAVFYGGLLRDDFKSLKTSAHSMYPGMEGPLKSANNRVKHLTRQIPKDVKASDQAAAATALKHLDIEIQRIVALFPPGALPGDVVLKFQRSDTLDAGDQPPVAESPVPAQAEKYVCPMHPDVTATRPGACPKCGMALEKVKN